MRQENPLIASMAELACKNCGKEAIKIYYLMDEKSFINHGICQEKDCEEIMNRAIIIAKFTCPVCSKIIETLNLHKWNLTDKKELYYATCSEECTRNFIRTSKKVLKNTDITYQTICGYCKKGGINFKKCSRCKVTSYCSRECQITDWKLEHKKKCIKY